MGSRFPIVKTLGNFRAVPTGPRREDADQKMWGKIRASPWAVESHPDEFENLSTLTFHIFAVGWPQRLGGAWASHIVLETVAWTAWGRSPSCRGHTPFLNP